MDEYHPLADAPLWFRRALAVPREDVELEVAGCRVHALVSGPPAAPGVVLVHGGAAHAHWWTHIGGLLSDRFRVVAIDLSGHGESGRRSRYSLEQWSEEIVAVAGAGGIEGRPALVGHSMGGQVVVAAAALHGSDVAGAVLCDAVVVAPDDPTAYPRAGEAGPPRRFPSAEDAIARFRPLPAQDNLDYVVDHVAYHSVDETPEGWGWKFDDTIRTQARASSFRAAAFPYLAELDAPVALLRSERGLVTEEIARSMGAQMPRPPAVIELPEAGHHAMLDQPLVLLAALRAVLAVWDASAPPGSATPPV
jgi:pimeloyl-ACP methyl ester carboxylesterase